MSSSSNPDRPGMWDGLGMDGQSVHEGSGQVWKAVQRFGSGLESRPKARGAEKRIGKSLRRRPRRRKED